MAPFRLRRFAAAILMLALASPLAAAAKENAPDRPPPKISVGSVEVDPKAKVALVPVSLDAPPLNTVWFRVLTRNGTAIEGSTFARVDQYLSFRPGDPQVRQIAIPLKGNAKPGSFFELLFPDSPEGAAGAAKIGKITFTPGAPAQKAVPFKGRPDRPIQKGAKVYALDVSSFRAKDGGGKGVWDTAYSHGRTQPGNGEPTVYADAELMPGIKPAWEVRDGVLIQRVQDFGKLTESPRKGEKAHPYGASVLRANFLSQQYGYYEWTVRLPTMKGSWPGLWLLPSNGHWPPEIDVLETWNGQGYGPADFRGTLHWGTPSTHKSQGAKMNMAKVLGEKDFSWWRDFHRVGVDWRADYTTWYVDGREVWQAPTRIHQPAYPLSDVTIQPGKPDFASGGAEMEIKALEVYR